MHHLRLLLLFSASLLCGAANAQDDWPEWMQKDNAREQDKLKFRSVTAGDDAYSFELPGKVTMPEPFDGGWYVQTNIESASPIECYIFDDENDLATLLSNLTDIMIESTATQYEAPEGSRSLNKLDAGAYADTPHMTLEMLYLLGEAPNVVAGLSKIRVATKGITSVACSHNTLGYRDTFATIFERFVNSLDAQQPELTPYYTEVLLQSINDMTIGFVKSTFAMDDEGDTLAITSTATIFPISASDLSISDSTSSTWSTPDGQIISAVSADAENGELTNNMHLQRDEDGNWLSYGTFQNKEIEQVFDGELVATSELGSMQKTRELFAGDEDTKQFLSWVPSADPTTLLEVSMERTPDVSDKAAKVQLGPISMTGEFDENGSAERATVELGNITMRLKRIWSEGTL